MFYSVGQEKLKTDSIKAVIEKSDSDDIKLTGYLSLIDQILKTKESEEIEKYFEEAKILGNKLDDKKALLQLNWLSGQLLVFHGNDSLAFEKFSRLFEETNDKELQRQFLTNFTRICQTYYKQQHFKMAMFFAEKLLNVSQNLDEQKASVSAYILIGDLYRIQGKVSESADNLYRGLQLAEANNDKNLIADACRSLGILNTELGEYKKALEFHEKGLQAANEAGNVDYQFSYYNNVGIINEKLRNYDISIQAYERAIQIAKRMEDNKNLLKAFNNLSIIYALSGNLDKSIRVHKMCLALYPPKDSITFGRANALYNLGYNYLSKNDKDSAFFFINEAISIYKALKLSKPLSSRYISIGNWYSKVGDFMKSLDHYYLALSISEDLKDSFAIADIYGRIADVYEFQQLTEKSYEYENKALNIYQLLNSQYGIAVCKDNISSILLTKNENEAAIKFAFEAIQGYQNIGDSCSIANGYLAVGIAHRHMGNFDSAIYYHDITLNIGQKCNRSSGLAYIYLEYGKTHQELGNTDQAFDLYEKSLFYAQKSQYVHVIKKAAEYLHPVYAARGQLDKAYQTLNIYQTNKDSLYNIENTRVLAQKEIAYSYEKEKQKQLLLQKENEVELARQKWIIYTSIGASFALLFIALALYRNFRNKYKANQLLRKQNDEIARQKAELETLDHTKSRFFANISHELRTPLTLISSPLQRLLNNSQEEFRPSTKETLQLMQRNTGQLKDLVDDILSLSKLESGKIELYEEHTLICPLLRRVFSNFDSLASHLGINFTQTISISSETSITIDVGKLEKIINNLLSNAVKYTPCGGKIEFSAQLQNEQLMVSVSDTGNGISNDDQPYIFDRFYQSKKPDIPLQGGTGIGLALAKEFAIIMGGEISVESQKGKGSTFIARLPCHQIAYNSVIAVEDEDELVEIISLAHLVETKETASEELTQSVLVVEDHADMQAFIIELLKNKYETCIAANGKEALKILEKESIDLIISDVMMPEMDGYTLLRELKQSDNYWDIPVIMLTALGDEENKLEAITIGVDDYLSKPFSPAELLARVHNLLVRHKTRQEMFQQELALVLESASPLQTQPETKYNPEIRRSDKDWLEQVEKLIRNDLEHAEYPVAELASYFHMSERQFQRKIKKITGLTPTLYHREIALQQARELLEEGTYGNLSAIASSVGISHVTRFSKLYEAKFGKNPNEFF